MGSFSLRTRWSLGDWQAHLGKVYGNVNSGRRPLETFAHVVEMATGISRGVTADSPEVRRKFFPRFLAWLLGLSTQLGVDLEQAVYDSYPGVCCYCREPEDCSCKVSSGPFDRLDDPDEIRALQEQHPMPGHLVDWVGMFGNIYGNFNAEAGSLKMLGHFFEELGEVCEATRFHLTSDDDLKNWKVELSRRDIDRLLRQELADIFAWLCGLSFGMGVELDADMKDIYQTGCPVCIRDECICEPNRVHSKLRLGSKSR